ncbi:hypothetical protein F4803DRAFT_243909 [Xylaria telfairii]|nr:hypothetical protein F4803DRAFT_243909 [Xylaria telfairii]
MADTQPGLEVVAPQADLEVASQSRSTLQNSHTHLDSSPEVVPIEYYHPQSHKPEANHALEVGEKGLISSSSEERNHGSANLTPKFLKGRRGRFILIGIGVFILVVVAAVVGGVVGSRRSDSVSSTATSGEPISSSPPTSSSSPTSTGTSSRPLQSNTGLAVAGWRTQNDFFTLRVFYQDQDDGLRFSEYNSDGAGWGASTKVDREDVLSNTSMGATAILQMNPYELFFQNTSSLVTGNNFRDRVSGIGGDFDSIDGYPILTHPKSRLVTCWPYIVLQKPNKTLSVVNWIGQDPTPWQNYSLGIDASGGTSLAILPLSRTYQSPYHSALVYRGPDGVLALYSLEYATTGSQLQTVGIGGSYSSSFGAFAVARENDPNNGTNIYILYQTESNDLEYVYYRGDSWELGGTSDVLKNADPSTDITCLTESIWDGLAVMSSKYDMSRCFFYSGGRIKHVQFDGTAWTEAEIIP